MEEARIGLRMLVVLATTRVQCLLAFGLLCVASTRPRFRLPIAFAQGVRLCGRGPLCHRPRAMRAAEVPVDIWDIRSATGSEIPHWPPSTGSPAAQVGDSSTSTHRSVEGVLPTKAGRWE